MNALVPDAATAVVAAASGLMVAALVGWPAARLRARGTRVGLTRKLFHFGVFTGAAVVHAAFGVGGTNAYGAAVAAVVLWSVVRGAGHPLFEALARPSDEPRRGLFVVLPLLTTAVGGLASAVLAGPLAAVGYLVAGWGDAIAEPVGVLWGRHPYRVPSLGGVPAKRSWEGTTAVLLIGGLAAMIGLLAAGVPTSAATRAAAVIGLVAAVVEAVSHHGTDNLTVQLATSMTAVLLVG